MPQPLWKACLAEAIGGLDWGVTTFATVAYQDGTVEEIENPRHVQKATAALVAAQRALARKHGPHGRRHPSQRWRKGKATVARLYEKVANQRRDFLHQESARLVAAAALIASEALHVKAMTASARGSGKHPGRMVKVK